MIHSIPPNQVTDLREHLTNKRFMVQSHPSYQCEQIISTMLTNYCCGPSRSLVFSQITELKNNIPKRKSIKIRSVVINKESFLMTSNMVKERNHSGRSIHLTQKYIIIHVSGQECQHHEITKDQLGVRINKIKNVVIIQLLQRPSHTSFPDLKEQ